MFPSLSNYLNNYFMELDQYLAPETNFDGSTLLDTHQFTVNNIHYEQKVYRLKDNSIHVETEDLANAVSVMGMRRRLEKAVRQQNYELAAELRDKIKVTESKKLEIKK